MKKKYKITFEVTANYPGLKETKILNKDFDKWLKDWSQSQDQLMPVLYERHKDGAIEYAPSGRARVIIKKERAIILDTAWDELDKDF